MIFRSIVLLSMPMSAALAQQPTFLTNEELRALLSKTTVVQFVAGKARGTGVYSQDGSARLDGGSWAANGTWRIDGNRFCTTYPGLRRGYETCNHVQKTGEKNYTLYYSSDGSLNGTWVVEK